MTPALTKQEAKEKCIKMWEHIAEHITDKEWRAEAKAGGYLCEVAEADKINETYKWHAIEQLFPGERPDCSCYLCEFRVQTMWWGCEHCPLSNGVFSAGCVRKREPFSVWRNQCNTAHYARASAAANRLVEKVRAWEVGE